MDSPNGKSPGDRPTPAPDTASGPASANDTTRDTRADGRQRSAAPKPLALIAVLAQGVQQAWWSRSGHIARGSRPYRLLRRFAPPAVAVGVALQARSVALDASLTDPTGLLAAPAVMAGLVLVCGWIARWIPVSVAERPTERRAALTDPFIGGLLFIPLIGALSALTTRVLTDPDQGLSEFNAGRPDALFAGGVLAFAACAAIGHSSRGGATAARHTRGDLAVCSVVAIAGPLSTWTPGLWLCGALAAMVAAASIRRGVFSPPCRRDLALSVSEIAVLAGVTRGDHVIRAALAQMFADRVLYCPTGDSVALAPPLPGVRLPDDPVAKAVIACLERHGGSSEIDDVVSDVAWDREPPLARLHETGHLVTFDDTTTLVMIGLLVIPTVALGVTASAVGIAAPMSALPVIAAAVFSVAAAAHAWRIRSAPRLTPFGSTELGRMRAALHMLAAHPARLREFGADATAATWLLFATSDTTAACSMAELSHLPDRVHEVFRDGLGRGRGCGGGGCGGGDPEHQCSGG